MQHVFFNGDDGDLVRACDDVADPDSRREWRDSVLHVSGPLNKLRVRFRLWDASHKAGIAGTDNRCVGCSMFAGVCGPVGWGWEEESALVSLYYVVKGNELSRCPSLEAAIAAANEYRRDAVEALDAMVRPGAPSLLVGAVTKGAIAAVCGRIAKDQFVPLDEFREILANNQQLLATLTAREQQIIRIHFGIERATLHAIEDISVHVGLPPDQLRGVEARALLMLGSGNTGHQIQQLRKGIEEERQRFLADIRDDPEIRDLLHSDPAENMRAIKAVAIFEEIVDVVGRRVSSSRNTANALPRELFHAIVLESAYVAHLNHRYRPPADAISDVELRQKFLSDLSETKFRISIIALMQGDYPDWLSS